MEKQYKRGAEHIFSLDKSVKSSDLYPGSLSPASPSGKFPYQLRKGEVKKPLGRALLAFLPRSCKKPHLLVRGTHSHAPSYLSVMETVMSLILLSRGWSDRKHSCTARGPVRAAFITACWEGDRGVPQR